MGSWIPSLATQRNRRPEEILQKVPSDLPLFDALCTPPSLFQKDMQAYVDPCSALGSRTVNRFTVHWNHGQVQPGSWVQYVPIKPETAVEPCATSQCQCLEAGLWITSRLPDSSNEYTHSGIHHRGNLPIWCPHPRPFASAYF